MSWIIYRCSRRHPKAILQNSLGSGVDGIIGPKTIAAANRIVSGGDVDILTHRMEYYVGIVE